MKLTFKLVCATDLNTFNDLVNEHFANGYKFVQGQPITITAHSDATGYGYQYAAPMLLEEEQ